jgi:hypothetical protein
MSYFDAYSSLKFGTGRSTRQPTGLSCLMLSMPVHSLAMLV